MVVTHIFVLFGFEFRRHSLCRIQIALNVGASDRYQDGSVRYAQSILTSVSLRAMFRRSLRYLPAKIIERNEYDAAFF